MRIVSGRFGREHWASGVTSGGRIPRQWNQPFPVTRGLLWLLWWKLSGKTEAETW